MVAGYPYGPWRLVDEATYIEGFRKDNRLMEVIGQNMVTKVLFDLEIYVSLAQEYVQPAGEPHMQQPFTLIERDFPRARCFCTAKFTTSKLSVHVILPNYKADFEGRYKLLINSNC